MKKLFLLSFFALASLGANAQNATKHQGYYRNIDIQAMSFVDRGEWNDVPLDLCNKEDLIDLAELTINLAKQTVDQDPHFTERHIEAFERALERCKQRSDTKLLAQMLMSFHDNFFIPMDAAKKMITPTADIMWDL